MVDHIFISYAREDEAYVQTLANNIRQAGFLVWYDQQMAPGDRIDEVVAGKIDTCIAFVVIMTRISRKSDWVASELERARSRDKPILPLLLSGEVFIPLAHIHYEDVSKGQMPGPSFYARLGQLVGATRAFPFDDLSAPTVRPPYPPHNLPQRNYSRIIGRDTELDAIMAKLGPSNRTWVVVIDGIGGVGKTTLALEAAYRLIEPTTNGSTTDGFDAIVWISAKKNILTAEGIIDRQSEFVVLHDLHERIGIVLQRPDLGQLSETRRKSLMRELLGGRTRVLLVLDNLEEVDDKHVLSFLQDLPQPAKAIVTTRHRIDVAFSLRLEGLQGDEADDLIANEAAARELTLSPAHVAEIRRKTGGLPLAIVWSLALMSIGHPIESVLHRLGYGHSDIAHLCFTESVAALGDTAALRILATASMFESPVDRQLLGDAAGLGGDIIGRDDAIQQLIQLSLMNLSNGSLSLLPLTRTFVTQMLYDRPDLQNSIQGAWLTELINVARLYEGSDVAWRNITLLRRVGPHLEWAYQWAKGQGRLPQALMLASVIHESSDLVL